MAAVAAGASASASFADMLDRKVCDIEQNVIDFYCQIQKADKNDLRRLKTVTAQSLTNIIDRLTAVLKKTHKREDATAADEDRLAKRVKREVAEDLDAFAAARAAEVANAQVAAESAAARAVEVANAQVVAEIAAAVKAKALRRAAAYAASDAAVAEAKTAMTARPAAAAAAAAAAEASVKTEYDLAKEDIFDDIEHMLMFPEDCAGGCGHQVVAQPDGDIEPGTRCGMCICEALCKRKACRKAHWDSHRCKVYGAGEQAKARRIDVLRQCGHNIGAMKEALLFSKDRAEHSSARTQAFASVGVFFARTWPEPKSAESVVTSSVSISP